MQAIFAISSLTLAETAYILPLPQNRFNAVLAQATEANSSFSILFIFFGLVLTVMFAVGLPFLINYLREVKPQEKDLENNVNETK